MPFLKAAGVDVHYLERGPATGAAEYTAVLLHGFSPDHRLMTGCFEPVFENRPGWRRLYLDLPGMGRTVAPESVSSTDDIFAVVQTEETFLRTQRKWSPGWRSQIRQRPNASEPRSPELSRWRTARRRIPVRPCSSSAGRTPRPVTGTPGRSSSTPRATFAVLDRAGHNAQIEQPALFTALIHEWLDRLEERQGLR